MKNNIDRAYEGALRLDFDDSAKFVFLSDCHRGCGGWGDNFQPNQTSYFAALSFYYRSGFVYAELGDGDELWENRRFSDIATLHHHTFWLLSKFYEENRLLMLHGNHDVDKKRKAGLLDTYSDGINECPKPLFPKMRIYESVVLRHKPDGEELLLLHGHQGDTFNYTFWRLSRFLVRYVWRPLEGIGFKAPARGAPGRRSYSVTEERLGAWSGKTRRMIIAGHTHRAALPMPGDGLYVNDGSCVHPHGITAIELSEGRLTLVRWTHATRLDGTLFVGRDVLAGPYRVADYFKSGPQLSFEERCALTEDPYV